MSVRNIQGEGDDAHFYTSNAYPMALLPQIALNGGLVAKPSGGQRSITVPFDTHLQSQQRIQLLIGSVAFVGEVIGGKEVLVRWKESDVTFPAAEILFARVKIDGIDSLIYDPAKPEQGFDPKYIVKFPPIV